MAETSKHKKHLSHILRVAVAVFALYFAFRGEDLRTIASVFGRLDWYIFAAAFFLYFFAQFIFVIRWQLLLRVQGAKVRFFPAFKLHLLGLFYNNCLPGSVGGDVLRAWYITKHTDKKVEAAMSVFVDRAVGLFCTVAMVFLSYWLFPASGSGADLQFGTEFNLFSLFLKLLLLSGILVFLLVVVIGIMYYHRRWRGILFKYMFVFVFKWKFLSSRFKTAVKIYCTRPAALFSAVLLSFICQAMPVYGLYLVGRNLGIEAHMKYYFVFFPLSWIIGVIPISVGGAGVMELGLKGLFGKVAAVSDTQGLILALTQRITWLLVSFGGLFVHIFGRHLPKDE